MNAIARQYRLKPPRFKQRRGTGIDIDRKAHLLRSRAAQVTCGAEIASAIFPGIFGPPGLMIVSYYA